ncbi:hypothetical protein L6164_033031 [Bauhinia variegata]|uniref:Uncharacterized protein n=1 Tax=Bauhinia variegata TaxID=167791 RepID=A0ACB9KQR1_BAUVA|nr:hypothetical protein L6164_033031 [Bauhinia variegata]
MMKKGVSERIVPQNIENKSNYDQKSRVNRFLITIIIPGSAGPIKFVVNGKDRVSEVIDAALKSYAREGRLPVLGSDASNFFLYCANGFEALSPMEPIGSYEARNFVLAKKQACPPKTDGDSMVISQKGSGGWKAWLSKSFHFKNASHGHRDIISM